MQLKQWSVPLALAMVHILGSGTPSSGQEPPASVKIASPQPATAQTAATPAPPKVASLDGLVRDVLASLAHFDQEGRNPANKVSFELPEKAVNDYLVSSLREHPRPGISAITLTFLPRNELSINVELDFDAVSKTELQAVPNAFRPMVSGKRMFKLNTGFDSNNGTIRFRVRDAKGPDGVSIPPGILTDVLRVIGSRQPESYDPEKPNPLPFGVQRVWTEKQLICGET